jgi:hypothetical protein
MRGISFVHDLFVVAGVFAHGAFDSGFYPVFGHIAGFGIEVTTAQGRVVVGLRTTGFYRNRNLLADSGKIFRHLVPTGKHGTLANFKYPSHGIFFVLFKAGKGKKIIFSTAELLPVAG